jgi:Ankyrin repeats (many copies)/Ankyrin repeat
VQEAHDAGLGTPEAILLATIPPLSHFRVLPNEAFVDWWHEHVLNHEKKIYDRTAFKEYQSLNKVAETRGRFDRFALRAAAVTLEFLRQSLEEPLAEFVGKDYFIGRRISVIEEELQSLWTTVKEGKIIFRAICAIMHCTGLCHLYLKPNIYHHTIEKLEELSRKHPGDQTIEKLEDLEKLFDKYSDDGKYLSKGSLNYSFKNGTDVLGWTMRAYMATDNWGAVLEEYSDLQHSSDIGGHTILHHLVTGDESRWSNKKALRGCGKWASQRRDGRTALHCAVSLGNLKAVELLLKEKADVNIVDNAGRTALSLAVLKEDLNMVNQIFAIGQPANLACTDIWGQNALHYAAECGNEKIATILLRHGIPTDVDDYAWLTPRKRAEMANRIRIVELIIKAEKDKGKPMDHQHDRNIC